MKVANSLLRFIKQSIDSCSPLIGIGFGNNELNLRECLNCLQKLTYLVINIAPLHRDRMVGTNSILAILQPYTIQSFFLAHISDSKDVVNAC